MKLGKSVYKLSEHVEPASLGSINPRSINGYTGIRKNLNYMSCVVGSSKFTLGDNAVRALAGNRSVVFVGNREIADEIRIQDNLPIPFRIRGL